MDCVQLCMLRIDESFIFNIFQAELFLDSIDHFFIDKSLHWFVKFRSLDATPNPVTKQYGDICVCRIDLAYQKHSYSQA